MKQACFKQHAKITTTTKKQTVTGTVSQDGGSGKALEY
jgi:hypothetical protein